MKMVSEEKQEKSMTVLFAVVAEAERHGEKWQSDMDDYFKSGIRLINE